MTDYGVAQPEDPPDTTGAALDTGGSLKISSPTQVTGTKSAKRAELYVIRSPRFPISRAANEFRRKYLPGGDLRGLERLALAAAKPHPVA